MLNKRKFTACIIIMFVFTMFLGCDTKKQKAEELIVSNTQSNNEKGSTNKKNIALVMKTLTNPFFISMEKGARKAEEEFGINLIVKTGAKETSIEQQIDIVENLISSKVDAIVIAPGSSTEIIPVLKKAQDAGIVIINIDNKIDVELSKKVGLKNVPFISVDNEKGAYLAAKYISDKVKIPTNIAIIEGIRGANNAEQRRVGAERAFSENPNVKIVASETANWKIDEAYDVAAKIFKRNSDIGAIFCANDMMALGVIQYLEKSSNNHVLLAGYDALDEAKKAIKDGKLMVTIDQQAAIQGYTGVKYAVDIINGKKAAAETLIDVKVVDLNNLN